MMAVQYVRYPGSQVHVMMVSQELARWNVGHPCVFDRKEPPKLASRRQVQLPRTDVRAKLLQGNVPTLPESVEEGLACWSYDSLV